MSRRAGCCNAASATVREWSYTRSRPARGARARGRTEGFLRGSKGASAHAVTAKGASGRWSNEPTVRKSSRIMRASAYHHGRRGLEGRRVPPLLPGGDGRWLTDLKGVVLLSKYSCPIYVRLAQMWGKRIHVDSMAPGQVNDAKTASLHIESTEAR